MEYVDKSEKFVDKRTKFKGPKKRAGSYTRIRQNSLTGESDQVININRRDRIGG